MPGGVSDGQSTKNGEDMKFKRISRIVLVLGLVIAISGYVTPLVYWNHYTPHNGSIGLIGAAEDPPTYWFALYAMFGGLPLVLFILGITLFVSSGFCLLFSKTVKTHCAVKSSAMSLGLSAVGVLGLICAFVWFTIVYFDEMARHPIEYPVSILLGILCAWAFVILFVLYFKERRKNWSIKGFVIDVLTGIVYLPAFYFVFAYLSEIIT